MMKRLGIVVVIVFACVGIGAFLTVAYADLMFLHTARINQERAAAFELLQRQQRAAAAAQPKPMPVPVPAPAPVPTP